MMEVPFQSARKVCHETLPESSLRTRTMPGVVKFTVELGISSWVEFAKASSNPVPFFGVSRMWIIHCGA